MKTDNFDRLEKDGNLLDRLEEAERFGRSTTRRNVRSARLSNLANEMGEVDFRAVDTDGNLRVVMSAYDLFDELGAHAHLAGLDTNAVVQFYLSADDGKIYSGGGAVVQDVNGITVDIQTVDINPISAYNFSYNAQSVADIGGLYGYADPLDYALVLQIDSSSIDSGATGGVKITAIGGNGSGSGVIILTAQQTGVTGNVTHISPSLTRFNYWGVDVNTQISGANDDNAFFVDASTDRVAIGTATPSAKFNVEGAVIFNDLGADVDIRFEGDTNANLFVLDAGLDAIGIGGAAASGYALAVTGKQKISSDLDINTNKFNVVGASGNTTVAGTLGVTGDVAINTNKFTVAASTGNTVIAGSVKVGGGAVLAVLDAGTYTPGLTNVTNVAASTAYECQYMRVGNVVTVSGRVDVDPTTAGISTELGIALPIASNLGATTDLAGTASAPAVVSECAAVEGDATNNRANMRWLTTSAANHIMMFTFMYEII